MYSVHQHWDPLKVCIVGRSYSPEFYSFIKNREVKRVLQQIAQETEEDYQKLVNLLESFGVKVLRPKLTDNYLDYIDSNTKRIQPPPMCPRDYSIMLGNDFYWRVRPELIEQPIEFDNILTDIKNAGNKIITTAPNIMTNFNSAMTLRLGKDLYVGTYPGHMPDRKEYNRKQFADYLRNYRVTTVDSNGHSDGVLCAVKPGLLVSLNNISDYKKTFPGWEVVYLPDQSWSAVSPFLKSKEKHNGKWWVPGEELNDAFTNYVNQWLGHWVGFVEETVFDVNMLVIDEKNVVCNNYNEQVFEAFNRHGITPHILNFRHRYFWDGGLHCITSDVHRIGEQKDYFPERSVLHKF
jgi:N-dimethylarginine dimethylaminohydrolase